MPAQSEARTAKRRIQGGPRAGGRVQTWIHPVRNILQSGELLEEATIRNFRMVRTERNRSVSRESTHYSLDAIISVVYRVNSVQATRFRIWATNTPREFIIKGFVLDNECLKPHQAPPPPPGGCRGSWCRCRAAGASAAPWSAPGPLWRGFDPPYLHPENLEIPGVFHSRPGPRGRGASREPSGPRFRGVPRLCHGNASTHNRCNQPTWMIRGLHRHRWWWAGHARWRRPASHSLHEHMRSRPGLDDADVPESRASAAHGVEPDVHERQLDGRRSRRRWHDLRAQRSARDHQRARLFNNVCDTSGQDVGGTSVRTTIAQARSSSRTRS